MTETDDLPPRPQRSAEAYEYDPGVDRISWVLEETMSFDAFLRHAESISGWSSAKWDGVLDHGGLFLNRRRIQATTAPATVESGFEVRAYAFKGQPKEVAFSREDILFANSGIVAVNKPAWLPAQPTRATTRLCLQTRVAELIGCPDIFPIHRLDRETSGLTLFAETKTAAGWLSKQMRQARLQKRYLAVVAPIPNAQQWEVRGYLTRAYHPRHSFFAYSEHPTETGKVSATRFEIRERTTDRAWVDCYPETGRTHQLRVHLAQGQTPIVGDTLYGPEWTQHTPSSASRLQLHAAAVQLQLTPGAPVTEIEAPEPSDFIRTTHAT